MRSGHHAVCNWIYQQLNGSVIYANDVCNKVWNHSPEDDRLYRAVNLFREGHAMLDSFKSVDCCPIKKCSHYPLLGRGFDPSDINLGSPNVDHYIHVIEDDPFTSFCNGELMRTNHLCFVPNEVHKNLGIGSGDKTIEVLILRDAYNFLASRIEYQKRTKFDMLTDAADSWKEHAVEFIRETTKLKDPIVINFNQWVRSFEYRRLLADKFGCVKFEDKGVDEVPAYGGGSSFTGKRMKQKEVLSRYKVMLSRNDFHMLIDDEIVELTSRIFNLKLPKLFT